MDYLEKKEKIEYIEKLIKRLRKNLKRLSMITISFSFFLVFLSIFLRISLLFSDVDKALLGIAFLFLIILWMIIDTIIIGKIDAINVYLEDFLKGGQQ